MSAKQPTIDQHVILHQHYPGDCCLCRSEERLQASLKRIKELEAELKKLRWAVDDD